MFGKNAGINSLEKHFSACKSTSTDVIVKENLKRLIAEAHHSSKDEQAFKKKLKKEGIDTVVRKNDNGRIYGITFIDHRSRIALNGSRLGKEFSANNFNNYWDNNVKAYQTENNPPQQKVSQSSNKVSLPAEGPHHFFDFLNTGKCDDGLIEAFDGLLPEAQGENYEEQDLQIR